MGEIDLWFYSCAECTEHFPIEDNKHGMPKLAKYCPFCGSVKIKLESEIAEYFG